MKVFYMKPGMYFAARPEYDPFVTPPWFREPEDFKRRNDEANKKFAEELSRMFSNGDLRKRLAVLNEEIKKRETALAINAERKQLEAQIKAAEERLAKLKAAA